MLTWCTRIIGHHPGRPLSTILRLVDLLDVDQASCLLLEMSEYVGEGLLTHHLGLADRRKGSDGFKEVVIIVGRMSRREERLEVLLREDSLQVLDVCWIVDVARRDLVDIR